ncbi:hypothetical protein niasHT_012095 [Heterodera trifolii]|uniref:Uncharacterized protein n=1 Tax=Heterodera trifolii TaxID=157864 RepID=A0ABD2LAA2_9BILA
MAKLENKFKNGIEQIECSENVYEVVQYHLERVNSELYRRLDHIVMSHGKISLIYLHACALRLASELGILINELEEIGTEWTSADAIDEVLKSAAGLEMNRLAILKM